MFSYKCRIKGGNELGKKEENVIKFASLVVLENNMLLFFNGGVYMLERFNDYCHYQ